MDVRGRVHRLREPVIADSGLNLRQLRAFATVAERRSFTSAADNLQIAQQAVSQQVKALERSLGVTLVKRSSRRVELTPEGTVFLTDCPSGPVRCRPRRAQSQSRGPW